MLLDATEWSVEQDEYAREMHEEHGLLKNIRTLSIGDHEYPSFGKDAERAHSRSKREKRKKEAQQRKAKRQHEKQQRKRQRGK